MKSLQAFVKRILLSEDVAFGDEWLSPKVVNFLIDKYADSTPGMGKLKWDYGRLRARTWGQYSAHWKKLTVNKSNTKNMFKQQVKTILHEIQHWNQHVAYAKKHPGDVEATRDGIQAVWKRNRAQYGYRASPHEVDARAMADKNIDDALSRAGRHASGKVEVEDTDDAWEEILDVLSDYDEITRKEIGEELMDFGMNNAKNMQRAMKDLRELGVEIK